MHEDTFIARGHGGLDETITLDREVLDFCPHGHPYRSTSLNNPAADLFTRYEQLGVMENLHEVIVIKQASLDLRPQGHPDRSMSLNNLPSLAHKDTLTGQHPRIPLHATSVTSSEVRGT
ncbi:hypothetical protein EV363DRAFT_1449036 [Boletus edulis]|nr:hypothetical protein EV363DRAFT_1449036 [Boletus edulis]